MFHRMTNYGDPEVKPTPTITRDIIRKLMPHYTRHGDMLIVKQGAWEDFKEALPIPVTTDDNSPYSIDEDELAAIVCQSVENSPAARLLVDKGFLDQDFRKPNVELIFGNDAIIERKENEILYKYDAELATFSSAHMIERIRMASLDCAQEAIVDLFAGIGYYSLPLLVGAKAKHLYACEQDPAFVQAFQNNMTLNKVNPSRYTMIEGDCKSNRPRDVAQRVILGFLPSCSDWMLTALECVDKKTGAILHCHELIEALPPPPPPTPSAGDDGQNSSGQSPSNSVNQSVSLPSNSPPDSTFSNIEKINLSDLKTSDCESSPVILEKPSSSSPPNDVTTASTTNESMSSKEEDSITNPPPIADYEKIAYEARAHQLLALLKDEIESQDLKAKLLQIQTVKSHGPHVNHVVFDIKIKPKSFVDDSRDFSDAGFQWDAS